MQMPFAHEMMSSLHLGPGPAEDATIAATGEWQVSRERRWAPDRALNTWDRSVENGWSSGKVEAWMEVELFEACGGHGIGASDLTGGVLGSFSQLSGVEQKRESETSKVLLPVGLADPSASGRVRGRASAVRAGKFSGAAARLGFRAKGRRPLLPSCALCPLVTTGCGSNIAGKAKALRSCVRDCDEEVGKPFSERGGERRQRGDGRSPGVLLDWRFRLDCAIQCEVMIGVTGEVTGMGVVDELGGWYSA